MMTLRNTVIAFFLILAAIVVTKTGTGDTPRTTSGGGSGSGGRVVCSVSPQRPAEKDGRIVAATQFRCDSPGPDGLTVTVHLQRSDGGGWTTVAKDTFVSNSVNTTREKSAESRTRRVSAACAGGTFRTLVEASVYDDKRSTPLSKVSGERRNPC
ncbi:hypothetical protein Daura_06690 [Dactylosporangium aurantiacum]|uniref:Secreted protein n=1 Tax=Dactylosporangium aurantiacum TaxID=35754 RepID=A0A9Q9IHQ7_9ACTN|nr:hypothetical protein [Dactylosporangium aurantiacum]MDG6106080.1 hypothetical protein [Dactylosporangium aurantiacum]UWZ55876.1 hypothetical protein Daura_06690 [Dactylosporangium aurantiacum]